MPSPVVKVLIRRSWLVSVSGSARAAVDRPAQAYMALSERYGFSRNEVCRYALEHGFAWRPWRGASADAGVSSFDREAERSCAALGLIRFVRHA